MHVSAKDQTLLVVDDDHHMLESMLLLLGSQGYRVITADCTKEALQRLQNRDIRIVLTDIRMPGMDGLSLAGIIHERDPDLPVIIMTAYTEVEVAVGALKRGAFDFLFKPIDPEHLFHCLGKAAAFGEMKALQNSYRESLEKEVRKKAEELTDLNREIIHRLTMVAEFRDTDTGLHVSRIGRFSGMIAETLNLPADLVKTLALAGTLHDIGKVAIPDGILLKPGVLTEKECEIIRGHAAIGAKMLAGSPHTVLRMAESIALHHHERWDGGGYPRGLKGAETPVEGRIVMLADQYDALRSRRPYKEPFDHARTCRILLEGDGRTLPTHFDPEILAAFRRLEAEFEQVFISMQEQGEYPAAADIMG